MKIKRYQLYRVSSDYHNIWYDDHTVATIFETFIRCPEESRIAPNQPDSVRLYFDGTGSMESTLLVEQRDSHDTHYIDISHNGFIVGGPIKQ